VSLKELKCIQIKTVRHYYVYIYLRKLSSVQTLLRFILHEPFDLSWFFSGRSLDESMYYCATSIYFF